MNLIIEWLPYFKQYRIWNSDYEDWCKSKEKVVDLIKEAENLYEPKQTFKLISYGLSNSSISWFKKQGVKIEKVVEKQDE